MIQKYCLENGLVLYCIPVSASYSIAMGIYTLAGPLYESKSNNGISHLLEHIHFRGIGGYSAEELYSVMDLMGATLRGTTYKNFIRFSFKIRPKFFKDGIAIIEKIISKDNWNSADFEAEKAVVLNQILEKNSYVSAERVLDDMIFKGSPIRKPIMGTEKTVGSMQLDDILEYKKEVFSHNNVAVVLSGALTYEDIQSAIYRLSSLRLPYSKVKKRKVSFGKSDTAIVPLNWEICEVGIAFPFNFNEVSKYDAQIIQSLICGGCSAELPYALIDKKQLALDIYSNVEFYEKNGVIKIFFSVESEKIIAALKEIVSILNGIKKTITEDQLNRNKVFFTDNLWYWLEDSGEINFQVGFNAFVNGASEFNVSNEIQNYESVNTASLKKAAKSIFKCSDRYIAVLGKTDISPLEIESIFRKL